jgi:hypothetical protein
METISNMLNTALVEKQNISIFANYLAVRIKMVDEMHQAFYYPEAHREKNVSKMLKETLLVIDAFNKDRERLIADTDFDPTQLVSATPLHRIAYVIIHYGLDGGIDFTRVEFETIQEFVDEINKCRITEEPVTIEVEMLGHPIMEQEIKTLEENNIFIKPNKDV